MAEETPQRETTPFKPRSPYAAAKLYGYWMTVNYREAYGFHASNGILFNHESPGRGEEFVTRKITKAIGEIEAGLKDTLVLGNLEAQRDWGHARDYMRGAWQMLQQEMPGDYVLATGETHSVREFTERAFSCTGIRLRWQGEGVEEKGIDLHGRVRVSVDPELFRPQEINVLIGDASKARLELGWQPEISFDDLIAEMVEADRIIRPQRAYGT